MAKIFVNKFTHISPVWLQLKRSKSGRYEITGTHDIDQGWMSEILKSGNKRGVKSKNP